MDAGKGREHMYRMYGIRTTQEQLSRSGSFVRHPGAGRDPVLIKALVAWISRSDVSAYAGMTSEASAPSAIAPALHYYRTSCTYAHAPYLRPCRHVGILLKSVPFGTDPEISPRKYI